MTTLVIQFTPEIDSMPPAPSNQKLDTQRIYRGYANTVTCFVRSDAGPLDLSSSPPLTAEIRRYGPGDTGYGWDYGIYDLTGWGNERVIMTVPATQTEVGTVQFSLDPNENSTILYRGVYRVDINADGANVYRCLLEIM